MGDVDDDGDGGERVLFLIKIMYRSSTPASASASMLVASARMCHRRCVIGCALCSQDLLQVAPSPSPSSSSILFFSFSFRRYLRLRRRCPRRRIHLPLHRRNRRAGSVPHAAPAVDFIRHALPLPPHLRPQRLRIRLLHFLLLRPPRRPIQMAQQRLTFRLGYRLYSRSTCLAQRSLLLRAPTRPRHHLTHHIS